MADVQAFMGNDRAATVLGALLPSAAPAPVNGRTPTDLRAVARLLPGVEVRSDGDLSLGADWNLQPVALSANVNNEGSRTVVAAPRAGNVPITLTLRAANNLNLSRSLSDGFAVLGAAVTPDAAGSVMEAALTQATNVVARAPVVSAQGASFRLVGGADLSAADVMATLSPASGGDVVIGRSAAGATQPDVLVRTTTGSIDIAAARDVKLVNRQAVVYTTGAPVDLSPRGDLSFSFPASQLLSGGLTRAHPLVDGGGGISVRAGQDIVGGSNGNPQYGVDWWWRYGVANDESQDLAWFVRHDQFRQGFGALGGGDVTAEAGRHALNLGLSAPSNGASLSAVDGAPRQSLSYGGGQVSLRTGGDITNAFVFGGGASVDLRAGGDINATGSQQGLQLLHMDTDVNLSARGSIALGRAASAGLTAPLVRQDLFSTLGLLVPGLSPHASLRVQADSGNLALLAARPSALAGSYANSTGAEESIVASSASLAAPQGSLSSRLLVQAPAAGADLRMLAHDDLNAGEVVVVGSVAAMAQPGASSQAALRLLISPFNLAQPPFENGSREPVRLFSADGSVTLSASSILNPLRVRASQDIVSTGSVAIQHQRADELSLFEAGRDIRFTQSLASFSLKVQGPGEFVALAGRHIDLGSSGGIGSVGNLENRLLPEGGAGLTLLAGVQLAEGDVLDAVRGGYLQPGATVLDARAETLATYLAQWNAAKQGASVPSRHGNGLTRTGHLLALATALAAGDAELTADLPRNVQDKLPQGLADADATTPEELAAWVARAAAKRMAEALPTMAPERQAVLVAAALAADLRKVGRAWAVAPDLPSRDAAYDLGLRALRIVFPQDKAAEGKALQPREAGNVSLTASQIKTQQGGALRVLTPGGSINAGETFASGASKGASDLGLVTTAGGSVELLVRDSVQVNQSRVFTVGLGDLLIWASEGNIDAGRGAKTVTGAPPPVVKVDANGNVLVDTSGSFSGSGIAVLDERSTLDLFAPKGEINAGEAGIRSLGNANFAAEVFRGGNDASVGGRQTGSTGTEVTVNAAAAAGDAGQSATSAGTKVAETKDEDDERKKRKSRRNLFLDFLGFGGDGGN